MGGRVLLRSFVMRVGGALRRRPVVPLVLIGSGLLYVRFEVVEAVRSSRAYLDVLLPAAAVLALCEALWFGVLLRTLGRNPAVTRLEWILALMLAVGGALTQLSTPPRGSIDAITYAVHGYIQVELGLDVYAARPADQFHGPLHAELVALGYAPVHETPSPYGPLWSAIEALAWRVGGGLGGALRFFQTLGLGALLASAAALAALARRNAKGSRYSPAALALAFLACPLAPTEAVLDAHLDITAYALTLGALWAAGGPRALAPLLLAAAVAIKPTFGVFLPAIVAVANRGQGAAPALRLAASYAAVLALAVGAAYAPYWNGAATLAPLLRHTHLSAWTTPLTGAAALLALLLAGRHVQRPRPLNTLESADMTALPVALIVLAYWLPWYGLALTGELLRTGRRSGLVIAVYLTLMGRLLGGLWFTAQHHYGAQREWIRELPLPGVVFQETTLAALALLALVVGLRAWLNRRTQSPSA